MSFLERWNSVRYACFARVLLARHPYWTNGIGDFPDVRETPLHSLETDSSVKLASSRVKPGGNRSGIGLNDREGIGVGCRVHIKMQQ